MSFFSLPRKPSAVCELNQEFTRVLIPRIRPSGTVEILGCGEVQTQGYREGGFVHLSDAAESVRSAALAASKQAGLRITDITPNLDDPFIEMRSVRGSSFLEKGREGFQTKHIEEAVSRALQAVRPSEKHLVYRGIARVLIDGQDTPAPPLGIFGQELTVILHLLFSESRQVQDLRSVLVRAGFNACDIVPTAWAALHGVFKEEELRSEQILILAHTRACHVIHSRFKAIQGHRCLLVPDGYVPAALDQISEMVQGWGDVAPPNLCITGEAAEDVSLVADLQERLRKALKVRVARVANPEFQTPRYSAAAGLVFFSRTPHRPKAFLLREWEFVQKIELRAKSFVQEYF